MARYIDLHTWNVSSKEATELQLQLRSKVEIHGLTTIPKTIAGCDISFNRFETAVYAGIVVLDIETLAVLEEVAVVAQASFPYVPGLLTFREGPALIEAWKQLVIEPDVVMFDGHGSAHPRGMGIAAHMGLWVDRPTFGCGKSILVGMYDDLPVEKNSWKPLMYKQNVIGAALRSKKNVSPVFISPGHKIDLDTSLQLAMHTNRGYRIPEPTRLAHNLVNALRRNVIQHTTQQTLWQPGQEKG